MTEPTTYDQLMKIDKILIDNREAEEDEESERRIQELWLGMSAILIEIVKRKLEIEVMYDTYHIEIHIILKKGNIIIRPVYIISQGWIRYHFNWVRMTDFVCRSVFPLINIIIKEKV